MGELRLKLLGGFEARLASGERIDIPTKKARAVLAYLALQSGKAQPRGKLADLLWSDRGERQAQGSLRQALTTLRKALEPVDPLPLVTENGAVTVNPAAVEVDAVTFERLIAADGPSALEAAAALYKGDLLEGLDVRDPVFEDWLRDEQARLRAMMLGALNKLLDKKIETGPTAEAIALAQRLLSLDRFQEAVHRRLMGLFIEAGHREAALQQYQDCRALLQRELGLAPQAETEQLHQAILLAQPVPPNSSSPAEQAARQTGNEGAVIVVPVAVGSDIARGVSNSDKRWRRHGGWTMLTIASVLIAGVAVLSWLRPWAAKIEPVQQASMAFPLPRGPSLAVMAFTNLGEDPAQDHFAEGLADDLITDLSQVSGLFVIDRTATFAYRGKNATVKQIAEALGVRYVLQGSLRRAGDRLRINAQLVDATTGGTLWAERIDGDLEDVFAVQDRFTRAIVAALSLSLSVEEREAMARGQTDNIEARVAFQKGWGHYLRYTPADNAKALAQFKAAIEIDPGYGRANAALALVYFRGCAWRWNSELDMDFIEANERALAHLEKAKARPSSLVNAAASQIYLYNKRYDLAFTEAARAIARDPNEPESYIAMAWAMITTGKAEASLDLVKRAMRLDPSAPNRYVLALGIAYFALGDLERAAGVYQKALERDPAAVELAAPLAAIYARLGRRQEARASLLLWKPMASQLDVELERLPLFYRLPYQWSTEARGVWEGLLDGLYVAALPLETTVQDLSHQLNEGGLIARQRAAESLGHFGPAAAEAVPALIHALAAENQFLRKVAAIALGKIGPGAKAAVPSLNAVQDEAFVGYFAKRALRDIAGG